MTAIKRWDIERNQNEFSLPYLEHMKFSTMAFAWHPIDKGCRFGLGAYN